MPTLNDYLSRKYTTLSQDLRLFGAALALHAYVSDTRTEACDLLGGLADILLQSPPPGIALERMEAVHDFALELQTHLQPEPTPSSSSLPSVGEEKSD